MFRFPIGGKVVRDTQAAPCIEMNLNMSGAFDRISQSLPNHGIIEYVPAELTRIRLYDP